MPAQPHPIPRIDAKLMCAYTEISVATYTRKQKSQHVFLYNCNCDWIVLYLRYFSNEKGRKH